MPYRSRLQRIQERRNTTRSVAMVALGIAILIFLFIYGVRLMASLAILIDKIRFGNKGVDRTDMIPPAPPTIWAEYSATNSATVRFWIISEPDSKVHLLRNEDKVSEGTTGEDGKLTLDEVPLAVGSNDFLAIAIDGAGNKSQVSRSFLVRYLDKVGEIQLEKPVDGQKFSGGDNPIEVRGKTTPGNKVYVNNRLTISGADGLFSLKINLVTGENKLLIRVLDEAGNESNQEILVNYQP